jgi:hypothetical protein
VSALYRFVALSQGFRERTWFGAPLFLRSSQWLTGTLASPNHAAITVIVATFGRYLPCLPKEKRNATHFHEQRRTEASCGNPGRQNDRPIIAKVDK